MSGEDRCDETRDLLTEVALGVADGAERARVLEHVAECADCRRELEHRSAVADGLLELAPAEEPPPGFELSVLRAIRPPGPRRSWFLRPVAVVAAVAAAVAITAGAMLVGFRDERRIADHYRATLAQANGTYFGAVRFADPAGRPGGVLFVYRGAPSWILVTVAPRHREAVERAELVDRSGSQVPVPSFRLTGGAWGGSIPVDLGRVAAVHLVDGDGRPVLVADLNP